MGNLFVGSNKAMTRSDFDPRQVKLTALVALSLLAGMNSATAAEPLVLSLSDAIRIALDENIGLKRSAVQMDIDENSLKSAKSEKQPSLNFSASENFTVDAIGDDSIWEDEGEFSDNLRASLSGNISLYEGGAIEASIREAEAALKASQNEYDRDRQALLLNTVTRFLEVTVRDKQVTIREEELANQIEELENIRLNFRNGIRVRSEVLRQEALVAQSRGRLIEARRIFENTKFTLKDILKIPAGVQISCVDTSDTIEIANEIPEPEMSLSLSRLEQRLDLEAQRNRLESFRESIEVARSGGRVSVSASASLSTSYSNSGKGGVFAERLLRTEPGVTAGIAVNVPIFDRRRTETNVIRSQLFLRREELIYENLEQIARTDLYQSYLNFVSAKSQLATAIEQLNAAEEALKAEQARYQTGLATLLDVNSIRSQRLDAAVSVEQARFDLFTNRLAISFEDGTIESFLLENLGELRL